MNKTLTEYDLALINLIKRKQNLHFDDIMKLYATIYRCAPENMVFDIGAIANRIVDLYRELCPRQYENILHDTSPDKDWQFRELIGDTPLHKYLGYEYTMNMEAKFRHYYRFICVAVSGLRFTEVKDIPGYLEYFDKYGDSKINN